MSLLKREFKTLFFIILATGASLVFLTHRSYKIDSRVFSALPDFPTPTPTLIMPGPIQEASMDSPDGTRTLTMEKQQIEDSVKYSFFTSVKSEKAKQLVFRKEEASFQSLSIPYNTWSPDNIYAFIKEASPVVNNYYVFFTSENSFPDGSPYLNIQSFFTKKVSGYSILEVTGWAAPNLLIINAKENEGEKKVSFWFDVPSQSFIQLGTYFN